jgi:hypothetical protein
MKAYEGVDVFAHVFLTSLIGGEWSASLPGRFTPGEGASGTHRIGGWVGLRTGLDYLEKRKFLTVPGLELRLFGRQTRKQSLYELRGPLQRRFCMCWTMISAVWLYCCPALVREAFVMLTVGKPLDPKLKSPRRGQGAQSPSRAALCSIVFL